MTEFQYRDETGTNLQLWRLDGERSRVSLKRGDYLLSALVPDEQMRVLAELFVRGFESSVQAAMDAELSPEHHVVVTDATTGSMIEWYSPGTTHPQVVADAVVTVMAQLPSDVEEYVDEDAVAEHAELATRLADTTRRLEQMTETNASLATAGKLAADRVKMAETSRDDAEAEVRQLLEVKREAVNLRQQLVLSTDQQRKLEAETRLRQEQLDKARAALLELRDEFPQLPSDVDASVSSDAFKLWLGKIQRGLGEGW